MNSARAVLAIPFAVARGWDLRNAGTVVCFWFRFDGFYVSFNVPFSLGKTEFGQRLREQIHQRELRQRRITTKDCDVLVMVKVIVYSVKIK